MIAQAGDTAQLTGKGAAFSGSQTTSFTDQGDTDTPNVQPEHLDSRQSPQKTTPCTFALQPKLCCLEYCSEQHQ